MELLLSGGADANLLLISGPGAPLHVAAGSGHENIVRQLLSHGAYVDQLDDCGCAPLHYAAQHGHTYVVECLIRAGGNIDLQQNEGATSLYLATYFGQNEVVETLINYGANLLLSGRTGWRPLDVAKQTLNWYLTRLLGEATRAITFV